MSSNPISENDTDTDSDDTVVYTDPDQDQDQDTSTPQIKIELQLGDVIEIQNPVNELLNNNTFIIDYIDPEKMWLTNTETLNTIRLGISPDGIVGDGYITYITIISRNEFRGYAEQNDLLPGKWVNIYFGGEIPVIITAEITNLENDMIEIKSIDGDTLYINFDYKGIPEDLPIELIEIREEPEMKKKREYEGQGEEGQGEEGQGEEGQGEEGQGEGQGEEGQGEERDVEDNFPDLEKERAALGNEKLQIEAPIENVRDQLREVIFRADKIRFGREQLGPVVQYVDVSLKSQRYSLETQVSDLMDELLSTVPTSDRTPRVLNNIHILIQRFKQLREHFSLFDKYGNVDNFLVKEASYKPLIEYFTQFNTNLYWIIPVVKNVKKIYDSQKIAEDGEDSKVELLQILPDLNRISELIENYKSNNLPVDQSKYAALYTELNPFLTPFNGIPEEGTDDILIEKIVHTNINTVIDNLTEMYSDIFTENTIKPRRFVTSKYNIANTRLETIDSTSAKLVTERRNICSNDVMAIKTILTLPEPTIRFSKINLPGTNILDRANLNAIFLCYWKLLKEKTTVNNIFIDNLDTNIQFTEQNFVDNIKNYVLNLSYEDRKGMTKNDIYEKFVKLIIPKTKVLFNLMKKYINGKLSIVDVVSYLEPFLIYTDDLTYMQYTEITNFIDEKISQYNKKYIERSRVFKSLTAIRSDPQVFTYAFSVVDTIDKSMRDDVFSQGYGISDPEKTFKNSEILRKIVNKDCAKLYTTVLSLQSAPLMFPSEFSGLFEEEKNSIYEKLKQRQNGEEENACKTVTVSKYYGSLEALESDNDKIIYFDKKYDKTNYSVLEEKYQKEVLTLEPEDLKEFIMKDLLAKKKMSEQEADYLSDTLIDGHKRVNDGHYAILYKGYREIAADEVDFYVRKDNRWILDRETSKDNINSDNSEILCDLKSECISIPNNQGNDNIDSTCESVKTNELMLQEKILSEVVSEFDNKYKMTKEEYLKKFQERYEYFLSVNPALNRIETEALLKYNNQKYKMGIKIEEDIGAVTSLSPYSEILGMILGQPDFVKKQHDLIKFAGMYTREANPAWKLEDTHWLYCVKTNAKLIPAWKINLANAFVVEGSDGYVQHLEQVKSRIGTMDEGGDWWCDKLTGWSICKLDFDIEEGYDDGFKISSRAVIEEDAGNKIISSTGEKMVIYDTPETKAVNNIVNAMSVAMGINMETQKEFIINTVLDTIRLTLEPESEYKIKVRDMAERGKKVPSYRDFYNTALLYYTLGMFLIAVQTSIPSVKTRKTHPGCTRSFVGYPFEGAGDYSSLEYLACVAYDIRGSGDPWNVLKSKKKDAVIVKLKAVINEVLLSSPDVKRKMEEKTAYLLTSDADEIPEEHSITQWTEFLPPLVNFKIRHLVNISEEFQKSLLSDLRSGAMNQREKILMIQSKIIQFSFALVERIQEVVKKNKLLLHTSNMDPYLENACCESNQGEKTIDYFKEKDPHINEYNQIVTRLSNMMEDIVSYSKSGIFFSRTNTKNVYPSISTEFNEKTIYMAFVHYCKYKTLVPVPEDLLPLCTDKPSSGLIGPSDTVERIIQKLKEDGRNYSNEQFLRLLQIIGKHSLIDVTLFKREVSSIEKFVRLVEAVQDEHDGDSEPLEQSLCKLILKAEKTFDKASSQYTREVKDLNNFLRKGIDEMKDELIDFVKENSGRNISKTSLRKMTNAIQNMFTWSMDTSTRNKGSGISDDSLYQSTRFYKNFTFNLVNVFPNIILNHVNYDDVHIPDYFKFSSSHANKIKKYITEYHSKFKPFYQVNTLYSLLYRIQQTAQNLVLISNATPAFSSIRKGQGERQGERQGDEEDEDTLKPLFDDRTSRMMHEYYLLRVFINYIELSDEDEMLVIESGKRKDTDEDTAGTFTVEHLEDVETRSDIVSGSQTILRGNKSELRQKVAELFLCFVSIMNDEKETIDTSYEQVQDRVFKLREKEKDMVTDRLKRMTDEERNADTILKINKLGMYSKGMQKGLTTLDKDFYDEERDFRDEMTKAERNIRRLDRNATDDNMNLLMDDYMEQEEVVRDIEDEANDMSYLGEDYYDGNTDGNGSPEYDDYEEEY